MSLAGKIKAGMAYIEITTENSKLQKGLAQAQAQLKNFGISVQAVGGDLLRLSGMMAIPLALSIKSFADFDDQMRTVQAVGQTTDAELAHLTDTAEELGATTAFSSQQVAEGMVSLARMGFTAREVSQSISPILSLVRATGTEMYRLGDVSELAAAAMRNLKIPAEEMADVCDVLTYAANASAMDIFDLGEAMKIIGPTAYPVGDSLRDVAANMMTLANAGIKGSLAGTALRKVYQSLAQQTGEEATQLKELGIALEDVNGNLRRPMDIMRDLSVVVAKMKSGEKINFSVDVFDLRGSLGALPMLSATEETKRFRDALDDVNGIADITAAKMEKGLGGALRMLYSRFQALQIIIGRAIDESFRGVIVAFTKMLDSVRKWVRSNKQLVAQLALVVAGAAAAGVALIALGLSIKIIAHAVGGLVIGFKLLTTAILLPVTAIKLLASVIVGVEVAIAGIGTVCMAVVAGMKMFAASAFILKTSMVLLAAGIAATRIALLAVIGGFYSGIAVVKTFMAVMVAMKAVILALPVIYRAITFTITAMGVAYSAAKMAVSTFGVAIVAVRTAVTAFFASIAALRAAIGGLSVVVAASNAVMVGFAASVQGVVGVAAFLRVAIGSTVITFKFLTTSSIAAKAAIGAFAITMGALKLALIATNVAMVGTQIILTKIRVAYTAFCGVLATAKAAVLSFNIVTSVSTAIMTALNAVVAVSRKIMTALAAVYGAVKTAILGFNIVTSAGTGIMAVFNGVMTVGQAIVAGFTVVIGILKAAFIALGVASTTAWASVIAPVVAFGIIAAVVIGVVQALSGAFDMLWGAMKDIGAGFAAAFKNIKQIALDSYEVIKKALAAGDMAGAAKVSLAALKVVWLEGIMPLKKAWFGLKNFLADSWTVTVYSILKLGNNLWYGLLYGLNAIGNSIANAWDAIWDGIISAFESTIGWLKKKWIQFKGFFDSDVNIDAEIAKVDQEIAENKTDRARRSNEAVNRRAAEQDSLAKEWDAENGYIDEAMYQEINENQDAYNRAIGDAQKGIDDARSEWKNAMDEVRKNLETSPTETEEKKVEEAAAGTSEAMASVGDKALGSWSAKSLSAMLGGGSAQERTANATEQMAKEQKETNKHLKDMEKSGSSLAYAN